MRISRRLSSLVLKLKVEFSSFKDKSRSLKYSKRQLKANYLY